MKLKVGDTFELKGHRYTIFHKYKDALETDNKDKAIFEDEMLFWRIGNMELFENNVVKISSAKLKKGKKHERK